MCPLCVCLIADEQDAGLHKRFLDGRGLRFGKKEPLACVHRLGRDTSEAPPAFGVPRDAVYRAKAGEVERGVRIRSGPSPRMDIQPMLISHLRKEPKRATGLLRAHAQPKRFVFGNRHTKGSLLIVGDRQHSKAAYRRAVNAFSRNCAPLETDAQHPE